MITILLLLPPFPFVAPFQISFCLWYACLTDRMPLFIFVSVWHVCESLWLILSERFEMCSCSFITDLCWFVCFRRFRFFRCCFKVAGTLTRRSSIFPTSTRRQVMATIMIMIMRRRTRRRRRPSPHLNGSFLLFFFPFVRCLLIYCVVHFHCSDSSCFACWYYAWSCA